MVKQAIHTCVCRCSSDQGVDCCNLDDSVAGVTVHGAPLPHACHPNSSSTALRRSTHATQSNALSRGVTQLDVCVCVCVALCDRTMLAMQACVSDKSTGAGHTAMICFELVLATADAPYHTTIAPNNETHWVLLLLLLLPFLLLLMMAQGVVAASLRASGFVAIFRFEGRAGVRVFAHADTHWAVTKP